MWQDEGWRTLQFWILNHKKSPFLLMFFKYVIIWVTFQKLNFTIPKQAVSKNDTFYFWHMLPTCCPVFILSTLQINELPVEPDVELYPKNHTGNAGTPNHSSLNALLCHSGRWGARLRCLCGLVCSDELCFLFSAGRRIDGVAAWHVRECCDVLRSPARATEGQGAPSLWLPPLSHWWRTDWLWSDPSASSWWCMEQQARLQLWDARVYTSARLFG